MTDYFLSMAECFAKPVITVATNVIDFCAFSFYEWFTTPSRTEPFLGANAFLILCFVCFYAK